MHDFGLASQHCYAILRMVFSVRLRGHSPVQDDQSDLRRIPFSRFLLRSSVLGGYHVIRKEAGLFYRTSSSVRLWWESKESKGPQDTPVILHVTVSPHH